MEDAFVNQDIGKKVKTVGVVWKIALGFICLFLFVGWGYGAWCADWNAIAADPERIGRIAGRVTGLSLIVWAVFYVIFARGRDKKTSTFAAIFFSVVLGIGLGFVGHLYWPERAAAIAEIVRSIKAMPAVAEAGRRSDALMDELLVVREDFEKNLTELEWENLLSGARIQNDLDAAGSRMIIDGAKAAMEEYMRKGAQVFEKARTDVQTMDLGQTAKDEIIRAYDNDRLFWDKLSALELNMILEYEKIVVIFETQKGKWTVENDSLGFEDEDALHSFNQHISNIETLLKQYEEMSQGL